MNKQKAIEEHKDKVVESNKFPHVMALTLNPKNLSEGAIRCIEERVGFVGEKGHKDKSVLYKIKSTNGLEKYEIREPLVITGSEELIQKLLDKEHEFIGFEDPDLILDSETDSLHLYFTIPLVRGREGADNIILLGHAEGKTLDDLVITEPVISKNVGNTRAKEVSFVPVNSQGYRLNLIESNDHIDGVSYSTVRTAEAKGFGPPWKLGSTVIHPNTLGKSWCAGHVSPGPFMPRDFVDVGEGKLLGFLNGRTKNIKKRGKTLYGEFTVGLFIYDYEKGCVDWVSDETLIKDSEAKNVTFASCFVVTKKGEGLLYAHPDDSFVRAYTIFARGVKELIQNKRT